MGVTERSESRIAVTVEESGSWSGAGGDSPPPGKGGLTCVGSEEGEEERSPGHGGDADSDPEAGVWVLSCPESVYITQVHRGVEVVHSNEPLSSVCSWPPALDPHRSGDE